MQSPYNNNKRYAKQVIVPAHYIRWIFYIVLAGFFVVMGLLIAMVVLLAGAYQSSGIMTKTGESTVGMRKDMLDLKEKAEKEFESLKKHFPVNQDVLTSKQILGIVENLHQITSRIDFILEHVDPKIANSMAAHINKILSGITPQQIHAISESVVSMANNLNHMTGEADKNHLIANLNTLVNNVENIAKQVNTMHKITLDWGKSNK